MKSVRPEDRRKSAVLYSPDACDKAMVHSAITRDDDDVNDMNAIYKSEQVITQEHCKLHKEGQARNCHTSI